MILDRDPQTGEPLWPVSVTFTPADDLPVTIRCRSWDAALTYLGSEKFAAVRDTVTTVSITSRETP